jgi:hypothetical protein
MFPAGGNAADKMVKKQEQRTSEICTAISGAQGLQLALLYTIFR